MVEWTMSVQVNKTWNGMEIDHDQNIGSLTISMKRDIEAMLAKYGMLECKPESTPLVPVSKLLKPTEIDPVAASFPYRKAEGELLWLARIGRPMFSKPTEQILQQLESVTCHCCQMNNALSEGHFRFKAHLKI
jgi:hypothetical protein